MECEEYRGVKKVREERTRGGDRRKRVRKRNIRKAIGLDNDSPALSACSMCYGAHASRGGHSCCWKRTGIKEVLPCVPLVHMEVDGS